MADLDFLGRLEGQVAAMQAAIAAADPGAAVPSCPGWAVRDLTGHIIGVHTWVTATLGNPAPADFAEPAQDGGADVLAARYGEAGQALLQRLRELPPDAPSWTFDQHDRTAGFWRRRQLHEVSVHRWDVEPYAMDDDVASDGVDEVIGFLLPRQIAQGRVTLPPGTLRLVSPDRTWTVGDGEPAAEVQASAQDLLLALWGRRDLLPSAWRDAKLMP